MKCVNGHDLCYEGPFEGCPYCEKELADQIATAIEVIDEIIKEEKDDKHWDVV